MQDKNIKVSRQKIAQAIEAQLPLVITTYTLTAPMLNYMREVLETFLDILGNGHMSAYLCYCLGELATNAKKANTKRAYFSERNLNLNDNTDYELGMKTFKDDTLNNINHYLSLQKKMGLYIKLILHTRAGKIKLEIRNNTKLLFCEYKRIHDKLTRSQCYSNMEQIFDQILDPTEGAGLGIVIMVLMLKKMGFSEEHYQVLQDKDETVCRLILPLRTITKEDTYKLSREFVSLINALPQFPENIQKIRRLLNDPDSQMQDIAKEISNDVSLTADMLKFVNSAAFALHSPCHNIADATKMLGINGIRNMIVSVATMNTLIDDDPKKKEIWNHSYKTAFYACKIAQILLGNTKNDDFIEDAYVCGLLHDIGKVIFVTQQSDILDRIKAVCVAKNIHPAAYEMLLSGANHSQIGALLAKKWNFTDMLTQVIEFHHTPERADKESQNLSYIVYVADFFTHYQAGELEASSFSSKAAALFNIKNEWQIEELSQSLLKDFGNR